VEEIFGKDGIIAKYHKDYEYRVGQIKMAEAVLRAFEEKKHLIVEAGNRNGKTMAYLGSGNRGGNRTEKARNYLDRNKKFAGTTDGKRYSVSAKGFAEEIQRVGNERTLELCLSLPHRKSGKSADS
jgi:hypothetical protein